MQTGISIKAFEWAPLHRLTARCLFVALAPLALDGCVSIGVDRTAPPAATTEGPRTGALEARLFDTGSAAKKNLKSQRSVSWKLILVTKLPDRPVREGTGIVWNVTDLEPGKYRLVASWGALPGVKSDTSAGSTEDTFKLAAGETASARVVVKKFPTEWVIGIGLAVVVGAVIGIVAAVATDVKKTSFDVSKSPSPVDPPR